MSRCGCPTQYMARVLTSPVWIDGPTRTVTSLRKIAIAVNGPSETVHPANLVNPYSFNTKNSTHGLNPTTSTGTSILLGPRHPSRHSLHQCLKCNSILGTFSE